MQYTIKVIFNCSKQSDVHLSCRKYFVGHNVLVIDNVKFTQATVETPEIVNESQSPATTGSDIADGACDVLAPDNTGVTIAAPEGGNAPNVLCLTAIVQLPIALATICQFIIVPL
jgi:hypothetical protein